MTKTKTFLAAAAAVVICAANLSAQRPSQSGAEWEVQAGAGYYAKGSLRGTGVDVDGAFSRAGVDFSYATATDWRYSIGLDTSRWEADFSGPVDFGAATGQPFDSAETISVSGSAFHRLDERFSVGVFGGVTWARASGASGLNRPSWSASDTATFAAALIYNWSPRVAFTFGVLYSSSLEDDDLIVPIIGLRYRHSEQFTVRVLDAAGIFDFDLVALDYRPAASSLRYTFALQWSNDDYRLGGLTDGSGQRVAVADDAFRVLAALTWQPDGSKWKIQPYVGYDLRRDMEFVSDEVTMAKFRVRNAWIAGLQASIAF